MKISIDTDTKIINLQELVGAEELYKALEAFLPNGMWKEFKINPSAVKNWRKPIIIRDYTQTPFQPIPLTPIQPYQPFPWITCNTGTNSTNIGFQATAMQLKSGVFNIECSMK